MPNKICVYAICKNESKFVDQWLNNVSEADYVVVLDTGSTDGTYEMLKDDPRVTKVKQKVISPWRFDVARNESMKLVPSDANILVCTDFDEKFEEGWATLLRDNWKEDTCRCFYWYAWAHDEAGNPTDVFRYDKITDRNYHWIFPVHEVLVPKGDFKELSEHTISIPEIRLHHYADQSKARDYSSLLELSVQENPESPHVKCLYARELCSLDRKDEAISLFKEILRMPQTYTAEYENVKYFTYYTLAKIYAEKRESFVDALYYCNTFILEDETYKDPYLLMAEIYNCCGKYDLAIGCVEAAKRLTHQHFSWVEDSATWTIRDEEILGYAYLGLGMNREAKEHLMKVVDAYPSNVRLLQTYITCLQNILNEG